MDLYNILNSRKLGLKEKQNFFYIALKGKMSLDEDLWIKATKKYKDFFIKEFELDFYQEIYNRKDTLANVIIYHYNYHKDRKQQFFINNLKRLIKYGNINWNSKRAMYWLDEVLYIGNETISKMVLDRVNNLNIFKNRYRKPTSTIQTLSFFKYLYKRGYSFEHNYVENATWFINYMKTVEKLSPKKVRDFICKYSNGGFSLSRKHEERKIVECLKEIDRRVKNKKTFLRYISLRNIDYLLLGKFKNGQTIDLIDKDAYKILLNWRELFFKYYFFKRDNYYVNKKNKDCFIRKDYYYPHYLSNEGSSIVASGLDFSIYFKDDKVIEKLKKESLKVDGNNRKYVNYNIKIQLLMFLKNRYPEVSEKDLLEKIVEKSDPYDLTIFIKNNIKIVDNISIDLYKNFDSNLASEVADKKLVYYDSRTKYNQSDVVLYPKIITSLKYLNDYLDKMIYCKPHYLSSKIFNLKTLKNIIFKKWRFKPIDKECFIKNLIELELTDKELGEILSIVFKPLSNEGKVFLMEKNQYEILCVKDQEKIYIYGDDFDFNINDLKRVV